MGLSNDINQYIDVSAIASKFANGNTGQLVFQTTAALTQWRQRFYKYRKLWKATEEKAKRPPSTPWDGIVLSTSKTDPLVLVIGWHDVPEFIPDDAPLPNPHQPPPPPTLSGSLGLEVTESESPMDRLKRLSEEEL